MKTYVMNNPPKAYDGLHTSKGNQLKWQQDGYWYKADQFGYEGVSETIVSYFMGKLKAPFPYVSYEQAEIFYQGKNYMGCRSRDYYEEYPELQGFELVPLERLHRRYTGQGLAKHLALFRETEDRVSYTIGFVQNITGLMQVADYLSWLIQVDAFFLNEDRHTNNIAVMWNPETDGYDYCPCFDFGLSLFSDTKEEFPLPQDFNECRRLIKAKPFSVDFDEQLDACERLGSMELRFPFHYLEMRDEAEKVLQEIECDKRIKDRITETLAYQAGKYQYMFS